MPRKPNPPPDDPEESQRFVEMARVLGGKVDPETFERAFRKVATKKPAAKISK